MAEYQTKLSDSKGRGADPGVLLRNCLWVLCVCVWELWESNTRPTERRAGDFKVKGRQQTRSPTVLWPEHVGRSSLIS